MKAFDRRVFLARGSIAVAAAGLVSATPGLASSLVVADEEAPEAESVIEGDAAAMTEPLVAHVRDLATGEIGLFSGTEEIVFHDPKLAARLFNASH